MPTLRKLILIAGIATGLGASCATLPATTRQELRECTTQNLHSCAPPILCGHDYGSSSDGPRFVVIENVGGADITVAVDPDGHATSLNFETQSSPTTTEAIAESCD